MSHQRRLQLDSRNPFAARLDYVLCAIGYLDKTILIKSPHVPGSQPAIVKLFGSVIAVIRTGDPGASDFDFAYRFSVPRKYRVAVRQSDFNAGFYAAGLRSPV